MSRSLTLRDSGVRRNLASSSRFLLLVEFIHHAIVMSEISFLSHFSLNTHLSEWTVQASLNDFICSDWTRAWLCKCMHHFLMPHFPDWMSGMVPWLREQWEGFTRGDCFRLREPDVGFGLLTMNPLWCSFTKEQLKFENIRLSPRFCWDKSPH